MRWPTHQVFGLGVAILAKLSPQGLCLACLGSILPDLLDQCWAALGTFSRAARQRRFAKSHRGLSHWFGLWLWPFFAAELFSPWLFDALCALALGAVSHLLLDFLTPLGIPLLPYPFRPRLAFPLCRTGSLTELGFFLLFCLGLGWLLWRGNFAYLASLGFF